MRESLHLYSHDQPSVFYTDNMADKDFLETCFSSLWENIVLVEKYSDLEPLIIPSDIQISILKSTNKINAAMQSILLLLPDDDTKGVVVAALNSEWNVEVSEHGFVTGQGQAAVLQVAVGKHIYVIQVNHSFFTLKYYYKNTSD
jgi:hypothetical protein